MDLDKRDRDQRGRLQGQRDRPARHRPRRVRGLPEGLQQSGRDLRAGERCSALRSLPWQARGLHRQARRVPVPELRVHRRPRPGLEARDGRLARLPRCDRGQRVRADTAPKGAGVLERPQQQLRRRPHRCGRELLGRRRYELHRMGRRCGRGRQDQRCSQVRWR